MPDGQRLLELALKGLEAERANIDDEIAQIKSQLNPRPTVAKSVTTASPTTPPKKKTMSAAARKKISEAIKRRYAERKTSGKTPTPKLSFSGWKTTDEHEIARRRLRASVDSTNFLQRVGQICRRTSRIWNEAKCEE